MIPTRATASVGTFHHVRLPALAAALAVLGLLACLPAAALSAEPLRDKAAAAGKAAPVPIIVDTDMGNDIDDALALAMLHGLQTRGACKILAVTLTKNSVLAGPFVDAMNTFYGRGDIPVGVFRVGKVTKGGYLKAAESYPYRLDPATAPDAAPLLRRVLARQPDASVVLLQIGNFANFAALLETSPDAVSPLGGRDLVKQKVRLLSIMAGQFDKPAVEFNVWCNVPAARKLVRDWPTNTVWSGFEIGNAAVFPWESIGKDFNYVPHHIMVDAYRLFSPQDRSMWDPTAALYAVLPDRGYFDLSPPGQVTLDQGGATHFRAEANGRDRYLLFKSPVQAARTREAMIQLISQPPATTPATAPAPAPATKPAADRRPGGAVGRWTTARERE